MGFYRGPNITRKDLLWHVDAGSPRSYGGSGTTWSDLTINNHDFVEEGSPTWDKQGFQMDGTSDWFETPDVENDENSYTVEAFFKFHTTNSKYGGIICRWQTGANTNNEFFLGSANGSTAPGYPRFGVDNTAGSDYTAAGSTLMTTDVWYHQVGTFDGTTVRVYLNGEEKDNIAFSGTANTYRTQPMAIGAFGDGMESGSLVYEAPIKVRYARMYNRVLTPSEILQNYNAQKNRTV